jgi:transaldolase / glucose-6-phosphate isomerase
VNTIPPATLDAFRDHGHPRASLVENVPAAEQTMQTLAKVGISIDEITDKLTNDGIRSFEDAFDKLLEAIKKNS